MKTSTFLTWKLEISSQYRLLGVVFSIIYVDLENQLIAMRRSTEIEVQKQQKWLYFNTSTVFKQRKQLIWKLKFHADTAAIFSQMNKTLNLQYHGIFCII